MNVMYYFKKKRANTLILNMDNLYVFHKVINYIITYYHDFEAARKVIKNKTELINVFLTHGMINNQIKWKPTKNDIEIIKQQPEYAEFEMYFLGNEYQLIKVIGLKLKLDQYKELPRDKDSEHLFEMLAIISPNDIIRPELSDKFERIKCSECLFLNLDVINLNTLKFLIDNNRVNIRNFNEHSKIKTLRYTTTSNNVFENMKLMKIMLKKLLLIL